MSEDSDFNWQDYLNFDMVNDQLDQPQPPSKEGMSNTPNDYGVPPSGNAFPLDNSSQPGIPAATPNDASGSKGSEYSRRHRAKKKAAEEEMKVNLSKRDGEVASLKIDNGNLKSEVAKMHKKLNKTKGEMKGLKTQVCKLKDTVKIQDDLVNALCDQVIGNNDEEAVSGFKRKFAAMSDENKLEYFLATEKKFGALKNENKALKMQYSNLCLRISMLPEIDSEEN
jgi:hypothetical protein